MGEKLKKMLEEKNVKQVDIARLLGVSEVLVSRYVSGQSNPTVPSVKKIAEYLGCKIDDIV